MSYLKEQLQPESGLSYGCGCDAAINKAQIKQNLAEARFVYMVRKKRLELLRLAAPEPKSGASTNFATSANLLQPDAFGAEGGT